MAESVNKAAITLENRWNGVVIALGDCGRSIDSNNYRYSIDSNFDIDSISKSILTGNLFDICNKNKMMFSENK